MLGRLDRALSRFAGWAVRQALGCAHQLQANLGRAHGPPLDRLGHNAWMVVAAIFFPFSFIYSSYLN
jgi:hypothetical protein